MRIAKVVTLLAVAAIVAGSCGEGDSNESSVRHWSFKMEKVWEMQKIGEDEFLRPAEPRVADDGTLYFHDFERHLSYIVDRDGKLVCTFASQGNGEGEVPFYLNCFPAGDNVVICAPDKLHFFDKKGQFVKSVPNNLFVRFPLAFKNENEFWVAPGALGDSPDSLAVVTHVNLASGEERTVHEFTRTGAETKPTGGGIVIGLTPQIKMGLDRKSGQAYFGKNSDTVIYHLDITDGEIDSFSFTATPYPVTETDKRNHFARFDIPEEAVAKMIEALPDQMAYYNRVRVIDGLVYLLSSDSFGDTLTGQVVNVYSPDGRHLYHGRIQLEEGWHISNPDNLQLADGFVYAILVNDAGNRKLAKYSVALPRS